MIQAGPHHQIVVVAQFAFFITAVELDGRVTVLLLVCAQALDQFIETQLRQRQVGRVCGMCFLPGSPVHKTSREMLK